MYKYIDTDSSDLVSYGYYIGLQYAQSPKCHLFLVDIICWFLDHNPTIIVCLNVNLFSPGEKFDIPGKLRNLI